MLFWHVNADAMDTKQFVRKWNRSVSPLRFSFMFVRLYVINFNLGKKIILKHLLVEERKGIQLKILAWTIKLAISGVISVPNLNVLVFDPISQKSLPINVKTSIGINPKFN